jgi:hypothetical protein
MEYDYDRYDEIVKLLLRDMWRYPDELTIGENISDLPEVKIIFDGYGDLETDDSYIEGGNKNTESYAIFIHKDAINEEFEFPEHEQTPWALIHRPREEVCIYAWYDVENEEWDISLLEDRVDDCSMNESDVMLVLESLYQRYYS